MYDYALWLPPSRTWLYNLFCFKRPPVACWLLTVLRRWFWCNSYKVFLRVSCRYLYSFVVYLYVSGSGSITSVGEERANLSAVVYL